MVAEAMQHDAEARVPQDEYEARRLMLQLRELVERELETKRLRARINEDYLSELDHLEAQAKAVRELLLSYVLRGRDGRALTVPDVGRINLTRKESKPVPKVADAQALVAHLGDEAPYLPRELDERAALEDVIGGAGYRLGKDGDEWVLVSESGEIYPLPPGIEVEVQEPGLAVSLR